MLPLVDRVSRLLGYVALGQDSVRVAARIVPEKPLDLLAHLVGALLESSPIVVFDTHETVLRQVGYFWWSCGFLNFVLSVRKAAHICRPLLNVLHAPAERLIARCTRVLFSNGVHLGARASVRGCSDDGRLVRVQHIHLLVQALQVLLVDARQLDVSLGPGVEDAPYLRRVVERVDEVRVFARLVESALRLVLLLLDGL